MQTLIRDYFSGLQAPSKHLYVYEHSGHGQLWSEAGRFNDFMVNTVLAQVPPTTE